MATSTEHRDSSDSQSSGEGPIYLSASGDKAQDVDLELYCNQAHALLFSARVDGELSAAPATTPDHAGLIPHREPGQRRDIILA